MSAPRHDGNVGTVTSVHGGDGVDELDRGRRDFIRRHFDRDIDGLELVDLVVDTEAFGIDGAASVVLAALEARGLTAAD